MSAAKGFLQISPLPVRSLLLAPLASVPVLTLRGLGTSDAGVVSDVGVGLLFSVLLLPFSYVGLLVVGLPLFILLRRFDRLLLLASCGLGAVVPYALFLDTTQAMALTAGVVGLAVGVAAYLLRPASAPPPS